MFAESVLFCIALASPAYQRGGGQGGPAPDDVYRGEALETVVTHLWRVVTSINSRHKSHDMTPTSVVVAGDRALQAGEDPEHGGQHPQREEEQRVAREDGHQRHRHRPCNQGLYCIL